MSITNRISTLVMVRSAGGKKAAAVAPPGQALYGTNVGAGTFSWVVPQGVSEVSVVAVGGGANGPKNYNSSASGGGGGGLGWKNKIAVSPGSSVTVVVGNYGTNHSYGSGGLFGGTSYFKDTSTVAGYGGGHWTAGTTGGPNSNGYGGGWVGDGGGAGGNTNSSYQAGSGAGGYTGNGANRGSHLSNGGGGGGSGFEYSSTYGYSSGGGVGLLGKANYNAYGGMTPWQTTNGSYGCGGAGSWNGPDSTVQDFNGTNGNAAIGQGRRGMYGQNPWSGSGEDGNGGLKGGDYGGGGGGQGDGWPGSGGQGGLGGVRIIWGSGREFPATNTKDV